MKFKITVAELRPANEGYDADTIFLQVLDLDESPAAEIARLLNPEVEYEEEHDDAETPVTPIESDFTFAGIPVKVTPTLPPQFGTLEAEKATSGNHTGRRPSYDRDAMIVDIKTNILTAAQIADKYGVPKQTVYNVRNRYVNPAEIAPDLDPEPTGPRQEPVSPEPTAYAASREALEERKVDLEGYMQRNIENMVAEGCSMTELEMMFPSVPVPKLREIFESFEDR